MLSAKKVASYQKDGFVKGSKILTANEVGELCDELDRVIADRDKADVQQPVLIRNLGPNPDTPVWQIVNIYAASPAFERLTRMPKLLEEVRQLMPDSRELRVWHDQIQYKPAEVGGLNWWHQDSPLWPNLAQKDQQITAWIALDDVDQENGCMSMVPGSQNWGNQIVELGRLNNEVAKGNFFAMPGDYLDKPTWPRFCPVAAGVVHFHHSLTWHGSHANRSGRKRRAIAIHYMNEHTTLGKLGTAHPMEKFITKAVGEQLTGDHFPLVWAEEGAHAGV